jgi:hypothetical protein
MGSLSLRESLIGAWELVSAVERDVETMRDTSCLRYEPTCLGDHQQVGRGWLGSGDSKASPGFRL